LESSIPVTELDIYHAKRGRDKANRRVHTTFVAKRLGV